MNKFNVIHELNIEDIEYPDEYSYLHFINSMVQENIDNASVKISKIKLAGLALYANYLESKVKFLKKKLKK